METLALVEKYTQLINRLMKSKKVEFLQRPADSLGRWSVIGEPWHEGKPDDITGWSLGSYQLKLDGELAARWKLYQMPHCCAICVSCNAEVFPKFQGKGLGTLLNTLRRDLSTALGYSMLLCTDVEQNTRQRHILTTNGWRDVASVVNRRTGNRVYISVIET